MKLLDHSQGNILSLYWIWIDSLFLYEIPLYGSSRLGVIKENKLLKVKTAQNTIGVMSLPIPVNIAQSKNTTKPSVYTMGKKRYESTDRLGNVRVTYTDKKSWQQNKFALNVSSSLDYYPFGSVMEGRNLEISNYRFGFQGQEKINEISGTGNHINFTYRGYDIRRGQFWSIDPLARKYPNNSPYTFVCNNPIMNIEEDGRYFISFSKRQGNNYIIHVTNQYWVEKVSRLSATPFLGIVFEASLWGARAQDPSFKANDGDYAGIIFQAIGAGSLKLVQKVGKVKGLGNFILTANRELTSSLVSLMNDPSTEEIAVDFLAAKSLEGEGYGKFYVDKKGENMTNQFFFNKEFIKDIENEILQNKELTSKKDFNLQNEVQKKLTKIMENKKAEIRDALKEEKKDE